METKKWAPDLPNCSASAPILLKYLCSHFHKNCLFMRVSYWINWMRCGVADAGSDLLTDGIYTNGKFILPTHFYISSFFISYFYLEK